MSTWLVFGTLKNNGTEESIVIPASIRLYLRSVEYPLPANEEFISKVDQLECVGYYPNIEIGAAQWESDSHGISRFHYVQAISLVGGHDSLIGGEAIRLCGGDGGRSACETGDHECSGILGVASRNGYENVSLVLASSFVSYAVPRQSGGPQANPAVGGNYFDEETSSTSPVESTAGGDPAAGGRKKMVLLDRDMSAQINEKNLQIIRQSRAGDTVHWAAYGGYFFVSRYYDFSAHYRAVGDNFANRLRRELKASPDYPALKISRTKSVITDVTVEGSHGSGNVEEFKRYLRELLGDRVDVTCSLASAAVSSDSAKSDARTLRNVALLDDLESFPLKERVCRFVVYVYDGNRLVLEIQRAGAYMKTQETGYGYAVSGRFVVRNAGYLGRRRFEVGNVDSKHEGIVKRAFNEMGTDREVKFMYL